MIPNRKSPYQGDFKTNSDDALTTQKELSVHVFEWIKEE
jgi:hypothetical protein